MKQTALQDSTERPPGSDEEIGLARVIAQKHGRFDLLPFKTSHPFLTEKVRCRVYTERELDAMLSAILAADRERRLPADKQDQGVERAALREALEELVALKDLKERMLRMRVELRATNGWPEPDGSNDPTPLLHDYARRKPLAWEAARAALAAHPGVV